MNEMNEIPNQPELPDEIILSENYVEGARRKMSFMAGWFEEEDADQMRICIACKSLGRHKPLKQVRKKNGYPVYTSFTRHYKKVHPAKYAEVYGDVSAQPGGIMGHTVLD